MSINNKTILIPLIVIIGVLHILLAIYSPYPDGYVYDFYSNVVVHFYENGVLATKDDCWVCYHPPLFSLIGNCVFIVIDYFGGDRTHQLIGLATFLNVISLVYIYYAYKVYLQHRIHQGQLFDYLMLALLSFLPVIVISSHAIESDMLMSTFVVAAVYYFEKYQKNRHLKPLILASIFIALAALTKYTGAIIAVILGLILLFEWLKNRQTSTLRNGATYTIIVLMLGAFPYLNNVKDYGTPFPGNNISEHRNYADLYSFTKFSLPRIINTFTEDTTKDLGEFSVYSHEFLSSHYGQLWTDHSFFTIPERHGRPDRNNIHNKDFPIWLLWLILVAGLPTTLLAVLGGANLLIKHQATLITSIAIPTIIIYIIWALRSFEWMLKTKYFLFLSPLFIIALANILYRPEHQKYKLLAILPSGIISVIYCFYFGLS